MPGGYHSGCGAHKCDSWAAHMQGVGSRSSSSRRSRCLRCTLETGMLYNTDGGTPMVPIGECQLCKHCMPAPSLTPPASGLTAYARSCGAHGLWLQKASVPRQAEHCQHTRPVCPGTLTEVSTATSI